MAWLTPAVPAPGPLQVPIADMASCAKPEYPKESAREEQQGKVTLAFLIDAEGAILESKLTQSSGFPLLDTAAHESIKRCKFKPAIIDGKPVEAWAKLQYVWTLSGPSDAEMAAALSRARLGAERGDADSQFRLGLVYSKGMGVAADPEEAMKWLRRGAEQGHSRAQGTLGDMLVKGGGVKVDLAEAVSWYRKAAEQGLSGSQHMLALLLLNVQGVSPDTAEAMVWLRKAAEQGLARAQASLAMQLLSDSDAPDVQVDEAIGWLRKAAEQSDRSAQSQLGWCYITGRGVQQDYAQAATWYQKAANSGHRPAQLALAGLYERGQGVPVNAAKASELYQAAGKNQGAAK